jgi:hypothetical protein
MTQPIRIPCTPPIAHETRVRGAVLHVEGRNAQAPSRIGNARRSVSQPHLPGAGAWQPQAKKTFVQKRQIVYDLMHPL